MRKLISILNPVYWTTAHEVGEAVNGYTLTGGIFRRETQVEFATGRISWVQHGGMKSLNSCLYVKICDATACWQARF